MVPKALGRIHARLMALAEYDSVCDIERFALMTSIIDMLPLHVQKQHGQAILNRQHFEQLPSSVLIQVTLYARMNEVALQRA